MLEKFYKNLVSKGLENILTKGKQNLEDFTFEKAGENIDQIVRDIRNIAKIAQRNIAHRNIAHRNIAHH